MQNQLSAVELNIHLLIANNKQVESASIRKMCMFHAQIEKNLIYFMKIYLIK